MFRKIINKASKKHTNVVIPTTFDDLPNEIKAQILSYSDADSIIAFGSTNKENREISLGLIEH